MIRDIKVNYGELKRLLYQLNRYRKALVQMGESVVKIQNALKKNKGFVITALVEQSAEIEKEIKSIKGEVDSIYNIMNHYVIDMTRIIAPVRESKMMRVDRNDIYWNKQAINGLCDSVSSIPRRVSTYGDYDFWPFDEDEEERERRRRNDEKLSQIQSLLYNSSKTFGVYKEQMNKLYSVVQKYENMDDSYSKQAKDLKWDNTSFAEGLDDIGKGAKKVVTDVAQGVVEGAMDLVKGLVDTAGGVLKYDGAFLATAYGEVTGKDIPDSLERYYEEKSEMVNAVLKDPSQIGEGIAQQVSDGLEEKGVAYSIGYVAPIIASFAVGDKGASKSSSVGKIKKVTSKMDDVTNVANKTSKVDDVVNGVNKASKVDDILNEGSKVADDVAKVPKSEIVKDASKGKLVSANKILNNGHSLDDMAELYARNVNSNSKWSWMDDFPDASELSKADKINIRNTAIEKGLIPEVTVKTVKGADGRNFRYADFNAAGLVREKVSLPKNLWTETDAVQFKWLDDKIGGRPVGYTWHHTEVSGQMELVPTGVHNVYNHNGGRTINHWAYREGGR